MAFVIPADHEMKREESKKIKKYLHLAGEQKKKLWNMRVTMKLLEIGAWNSL